MQRKDLEGLSRDALVAKAEELGVVRPRTLTMPELLDEILLATERKTGLTQRKSRGWFGRARDLLTSVIDRGLAEPQPGRPGERPRASTSAPSPLPTVTLAEIYAAQGHFERAITTLDDVIERDPEHAEARRLRDRFAEQLRRTRPSAPPPPVELKPVTIPPPPAVASALSSVPAIEPRKEEKTAPVVDQALAAEVPAALEERYDVDEVVAVAVDPHTVYVYWEIRPTTLAEARAKAPSGTLTLRVLTTTSHPQGGAPPTEVRDIRVDALFGEVFLRDVPESANIRVTIGWKSGELTPLAVGLELATPRETPARQVSREFARFDSAGVADAYDALRAGGLSRGAAQGQASAPGLGRVSREEIAYGHSGSESDEPTWSPTTETKIVGGRVLRVEQRTFRGGASDTFRREIRFMGASDQNAPARRVDSSSVSVG